MQARPPCHLTSRQRLQRQWQRYAPLSRKARIGAHEKRLQRINNRDTVGIAQQPQINLSRGGRRRAAWNTNREPGPEAGPDFSSFEVKVINPVYDERAQINAHEERLQLIDSRETVGFDKLVKCLVNPYRATWNTNREPGPEFGPGFFIFNVKVIETLEVVPFQLGSGQ